MGRKTLALVVLTVGLGGIASGEEPAGFKVIVNASNPETSIRRSALSDIFLKKTTRWPHGLAAAPVDQSAVSAIRAAFTKQIHQRGVDAVQNYWQQQIFSGRDTPPHVKVSDAEAMAFVAATPGGIAYVADTTPLASGVKVLTVTD